MAYALVGGGDGRWRGAVRQRWAVYLALTEVDSRTLACERRAVRVVKQEIEAKNDQRYRSEERCLILGSRLF
jgi:hypothetical protein